LEKDTPRLRAQKKEKRAGSQQITPASLDDCGHKKKKLSKV